MSRRAAVAALVALALLGTARSLGNGFAFDDVPMVVENTQIHSLEFPWVYAQQSYWPPRNLGDAYRPWTVWWLAIQYAVAGATPLVFHLVSLALTVALSVAVFGLALAWAPTAAAFAGAALFAVHPVHVEATANVVGQGELWMALFATLAAAVYANARRTGVPGATTRLGLALLYLLAAASKEQGIVLPGLLVVFELCAPAGLARVSARKLLPTYLLLAVVGGGFLLARFAVLSDMGGGPAAAGIAGLGPAGRLGVMLTLIPDWLRLFLWPQSLLAQYSPPAYGAAGWTAAAWVGLALIATLAGIGIAARRRVPAVAAGIAWTAVALLPVSNLPFPTGVLIAERTLLLPSVGVALVAAGLLSALLGSSAADRRRPGTLPVVLSAAAVAALVALGAARSWSRQAVWRDNDTLFSQTVADAPRSYRAWFVYGRDLLHRSRPAEAKAMFARAAELWDRDRRVFEDWGFILVTEGRCDLAVPVLDRGVAAEPTETLARSRMFECLLKLGRYADARTLAEAGVALGNTEFATGVRRARALEEAPNASPESNPDSGAGTPADPR